MVADGQSQVTATVTATDASGGVQGDSVTVTTSGATVSQQTCTQTTDASGTCTVSFTVSTNLGQTTVDAADSTSSVNAQSQSFNQVPGSVAHVVLQPISAITADGVSTTTATAAVSDNYGHALSGENVVFTSSDHGESVGPTADNGNGTYSAQITASTTVGSATITATDGSKSGTTTLSQVAGPPASPIAVAFTSSTVPADGTSTTTATATVSDAFGHLLPNETTVGFTSSDPLQAISAVTNHHNGTYSVTIRASTTVGTPTITATDGSATGSAIMSQTAGSPAGITLVLNPPTILADAQSTTSATATITDAQGHLLPSETAVKFTSTDKGQFVGAVTNNGDGTYTVQIRGSRTVGSSTITATDGAAKPGQATLIQAAGPSTTSLFASTSSLVTNQPVTLVAQVNGGTGAPSGTITFENSGAAIAGCAGEPVSPSSTVATCQTSFGAAGSPLSLTAVFVPGTGSTAPGSTGSLSLNVKPDSTSVAVSGPAPAVTKRRITYIAVVSPPSSRPGPIEPTGTVRFFDNGKRIAACTAQPVVNSTSTCVVVYARAGSHSITADYSGDANFTGSSSRASRVTVTTAKRPIRGQLNPTMQWTFRFRQSYTTVVQLMVNGTSAGDIVTVTCHGPGCPFTKRVSKLKAPSRCARRTRQHRCTAPQQVDIARALRSHHLRAGVTVTVTITRPNWVGKSYTFKMRVGHGPRIGIGCLAPGSVKPGVGCTT